jgi:predicted phage gp36 major capsid-like protein
MSNCVVVTAGPFTTGTGSDQPFGVITSVKAVTGSRVTPTTAATYKIDDVYKIQNALPPRFSANASWMANLAILNATRRFGEGTTGSNSAFWAAWVATSPRSWPVVRSTRAARWTQRPVARRRRCSTATSAAT